MRKLKKHLLNYLSDGMDVEVDCPECGKQLMRYGNLKIHEYRGGVMFYCTAEDSGPIEAINDVVGRKFVEKNCIGCIHNETEEQDSGEFILCKIEERAEIDESFVCKSRIKK